MASSCWNTRRRRRYIVVGTIYVLCVVAYVHENPSSLKSRYLALEDLMPVVDGSNERRKASTTTTHLQEESKHDMVSDMSNDAMEEWRKSHFFVLSLPGSGMDTTHRYFQCGLGGDSHHPDHQHHPHDLLANYWVPPPTSTADTDMEEEQEEEPPMEIGRCMQQNIHAQQPPLQGCGKALVWSNVGYMASPGKCYFPALDEGGLEAIVQAYPHATFLNVIQTSPDAWLRSLSTQWQTKLASWCHFGDDSIVPTPRNNSTRAIPQRDWKKFYLAYQDRLRHFAKTHPTVKYVEVALDDPNTAQLLHDQLGIGKGCWQSPHPSALSTTPQQQPQHTTTTNHNQNPWMKIPTPVLVTSLPQSGTTSAQRYFQCGLGYFEAAHHWTRDPHTHAPIPIGKCMHRNLQHQQPLLQGCGKFQVWADTGYVEKPSPSSSSTAGECFDPTLHPDGLEAFYQSYPNATLMNVIRKPEDWYDSISTSNSHWMEQWSQSSCSGAVPGPGASRTEWIDFYQDHTERIRYFGKTHPSLTYVEVDLAEPSSDQEAGRALEEQVGIPASCWGNCHKHHPGGFCHVLHQLRTQEGRRRTIRNALSQRATAVPRTIMSDRDLQVADKWAEYERQFQQLAHTPVHIVDAKGPLLRKEPMLAVAKKEDHP